MYLELSKESQQFLTNYSKDNNLSEKETLELALSYFKKNYNNTDLDTILNKYDDHMSFDEIKSEVSEIVSLHKQGRLKTYSHDEAFIKIRAKTNENYI